MISEVILGVPNDVGTPSITPEQHNILTLRRKFIYMSRLPPDKPLGKTAVVVLLFYRDVLCFKLYRYSSNVGCY